MKKYLMILLILLVSGCTIVGNVIAPEYTFEKGFNEMLELDKKYNASFYTEALDVENRFSDVRIYYFDWNRTIIGLENVDGIIEELEEMKERVNGMKETKDTKLVIQLIDSRIRMLEAEKAYKLGIDIGGKGDTEDGFKCGDKPFVIEASELFNESTVIGREVTGIWDDFLTDYPQTRPFLTEDKRPKFYDSPFWPISRFSGQTLGRINRLCKDKE